MILGNSQILVLHWFYNCSKKGEKATYKGSLEHFGQTLKIHEPMDVLLSLLNMGFIKIDKTKLEVSITKAGIDEYNELKKKQAK